MGLKFYATCKLDGTSQIYPSSLVFKTSHLIPDGKSLKVIILLIFKASLTYRIPGNQNGYLQATPGVGMAAIPVAVLMGTN